MLISWSKNVTITHNINLEGSYFYPLYLGGLFEEVDVKPIHSSIAMVLPSRVPTITIDISFIIFIMR